MRMRSNVLLYVLVIILIAPVAAAAAPGDIVNSFPTPGRYPTGLAFDGESLWLADRMSDSLYRINPKDGSVSETIEAPGYQIEGLSSEGGFLWVLDAEQRAAFKLDRKTGIAEKTIPVPCAEPQGLAWDGKHLWVADLKKDRLLRISTEDGTTITDIPSPSGDPHGLAYDGKYLWVSDRSEDMIYMVCPRDGRIVVELRSPSKFPRGLAFDGELLWNVDYQTDRLYRIKLQDAVTHVCTDGRKETFEFVHEFRNYGPGTVTSLDVYLAVPRELLSQKILGKLTFTPEPKGFLTDKWGQKVAHYHYENLLAGKFVTTSMEGQVELYKIRFFLFPEKVGSLGEVPEQIKQRYLADGTKFCIDDPLIKETAQKVVGNETNCYWIARKLFDHVIEKMHYEMAGGWNIAPTVLKRGSGSCSEFSFVYIALCRAAGLPARYVGSIVVRGDDASTDNVFHRWPEVYLPNYGWVPIDPSSGRGALKSPAQKASVIGNRGNQFLITTIGGGGSEYLEWNYNCNEMWRSKGPCRIEIRRFGEWSPPGQTKGQTELP